MKKSLLITLFIVGTYTLSHAQFTICEKCGETKEGNKIIIEGKGKGSWIVKYNLFGHTTTFFRANGDKITLKIRALKRKQTDSQPVKPHPKTDSGTPKWCIKDMIL